ncbi:MAG: Uma2 family endonuclease [Cyclobacteriaceae bacterium]|nr:Uma2 family endonuclease [Cyclobacteriaceae bacterium]
MQTAKTLLPPRTIMEVYQMLPEGTLAEVIHGNLFMSPSPSTSHQRVLRKLSVQFSNWVEQNNADEVFMAPYDVYLDEEANVVQPDIIFISSAKSKGIRSNGFYGTPDLIIEILSPGNARHDLEIKKELYERFGVTEYWVVNPDTREATGFFLQGKVYASPVTFTGLLRSRLLNTDIEF